MFVFGSAPKCAGAGEKIFVSVFNSTWTSSPTTVSKFMRSHLLKVLVIVRTTTSSLHKQPLLDTMSLHRNAFRSIVNRLEALLINHTVHSSLGDLRGSLESLIRRSCKLLSLLVFRLIRTRS